MNYTAEDLLLYRFAEILNASNTDSCIHILYHFHQPLQTDFVYAGCVSIKRIFPPTVISSHSSVDSVAEQTV